LDSASRQGSLKKAGRRTFSRDRPDKIIQLQVGVARVNIAEKRAAFSLRRRFHSLFKMPVIAHDLEVPSRSTFFFSRRNARSLVRLFLI